MTQTEFNKMMSTFVKVRVYLKDEISKDRATGETLAATEMLIRSSIDESKFEKENIKVRKK